MKITEQIKKSLILHLQAIEAGMGEAIGNGSFKNLKYAASLNNSLEMLNAFLQSIPLEENKKENEKKS